MLIKRLEDVMLKKVVKQKLSNGHNVETYEDLSPYKVQIQELDDEISANIYGASIINMLIIKSPIYKLENYLSEKLNNKTDNISQYRIFIGERKYRINSVNKKGVTIELI